MMDPLTKSAVAQITLAEAMNQTEVIDSADQIKTRGYQMEMLEQSLKHNIIVALETGSGKTHIAVLRLKWEIENELQKLSWFLAPTVSLCEQQRAVISKALPVSVGLISGASAPDQWKDQYLWRRILAQHRIMVSTPQVLLDALRHGYINLGVHVSLIVFDEAHHAVDKHPYNCIMKEFYFTLPGDLPSCAGASRTRPRILGLTASPIFGGNVEVAFRTIESNLDSIICKPHLHREELARFVHRPVFKCVNFHIAQDQYFSTNLAALNAVLASINIEEDPYIKGLKRQLAKQTVNSEQYRRFDQKLSSALWNKNTFTHKGLRSFAASAAAILEDLGDWAAEWYVWTVIEKAKAAALPDSKLMMTWRGDEKVYLQTILAQIPVTPPSYFDDDLVDGVTPKVNRLIEHLLQEKEVTEDRNEAYSALIFVNRRDIVFALRKLLSEHPVTKKAFSFGALVGTSESSQRHSFLEITSHLREQSQDETLEDFKIGAIDVIVATAVAEEGIDVQACGSVVRWDLPTNVVSWAQSRGRARKERSSFTLMVERESEYQKIFEKWLRLEDEMESRYHQRSMDMQLVSSPANDSEGQEDTAFCVPSTGARLTLHSAIPHLHHFCAVVPSSALQDYRPIFDLDPTDFPLGWHAFDDRPDPYTPQYQGPFGSTVTLPRFLPQSLRVHSTPKIHSTKMSAHRHSAFNAYIALYEAGLVGDNLLPLSPRDEDIEDLKKEVEGKRGFRLVSAQENIWVPSLDSDAWDPVWHKATLHIGEMHPIHIFTRQPIPESGPTLYIPGQSAPVVVRIEDAKQEFESVLSDTLDEARQYTRMIFWCLNGSRMKWNNLEFSYLFLPVPSDTKVHDPWEERRTWLSAWNATANRSEDDAFNANAWAFGKAFSHPKDIHVVREGFKFSKAFRFVRWRYTPLTEEELEELKSEKYENYADLKVTYPLLVVRPLPSRTNFLVPFPPVDATQTDRSRSKPRVLLPAYSAVTLLSKRDCDFAFLLPSILRAFQIDMTVRRLRDSLFASPHPLSRMPLSLLAKATTTPVAQERFNYQRLETLGDTVLKYIVCLQLFDEFELWHEGYLSRQKDHLVSNGRLARESVSRGLASWIIRDRLLGRKWKPSYLIADEDPERQGEVTEASANNLPSGKVELSTKVLADVVEAIIGAAYLHNGFEAAFECIKTFGLGFTKWKPLPLRLSSAQHRYAEADKEMGADHFSNLPEISRVEELLGYNFKRKIILAEALTHGSYQHQGVISYERLEFLGDSILDMIVTEYLYQAPGKHYSPGNIYLRRSALVNAQILAYLCLQCNQSIETKIPRLGVDGIELDTTSQQIGLWQCLLHSSPKILDDQSTTSTRFRKLRGSIQEELQHGSIFPWADLTRLQAPKFFSDIIESIIGGVFVDSGGDFDCVRGVLRQLGHSQIMERIVKEGVDVLHPVSRLALWAGKREKKVEYKYTEAGGRISCRVFLDEEELEDVVATDIHHGKATKQEVRLAAAELAIKRLKLRNAKIDNDLQTKGAKSRKALRSNN